MINDNDIHDFEFDRLYKLKPCEEMTDEDRRAISSRLEFIMRVITSTFKTAPTEKITRRVVTSTCALMGFQSPETEIHQAESAEEFDNLVSKAKREAMGLKVVK